jgi:3-dehydroquinate dehydratase II
MTALTRVLVLNGPNLNRLGTREPAIYGTATLDDLRTELDSAAEGIEIDLRQSNDEATLIGWLHEAVDARTPIILNPAAFTHYSYALRDAVALVTEAGIPVIEVHLSNPHAREEFRHTSVISSVATGVIAGFGFGSYRLALEHLLRLP